MTKITRFWAIAAMFFISSKTFAWDGSSDISWFSSSKTEYHITSAEQLKGLSDLVLVGNTFEDKTIMLDNDIDLGYGSWQPIGGNTYNAASFNGIFDGQNHKITAVHPVLDSNSFYPMQSYGLFGNAGSKSIIKNLTVTGGTQIAPSSTTNTLYAGGVVGSTNGRVENVQTNFNISASDASYYDVQSLYAGGICGKGNIVTNAKSSGKIGLAYANVQWRIRNQGGIGGIVGRGGNINKAQSDCVISVWGKNMTAVGGIVGEGLDCNVDNACFYGSLSIQQDIWYNPSAFLTACSGIVGRSDGSLSVSNCISAPSSYSVNVSAIYLAPIAGDSQSQSWTGSNNYYTLPPTASDNLGQVITENKLRTGEPLEGFDSDIWEFKTNELPSIKNIGVGEATSISNIENNYQTDFIINKNKITFPNIKAKTRIEIYNLDGQKEYSGYINSNESISLRKGVYVIKIEKTRIKIAI